MLELKATLKEFTDHLGMLVNQIIAFEEIYSSVYQLPPTRVIAKRSKEKIQVDSIPAGCSRLKSVNSLMQYIKFVGLLNPEVHSFLPPDVTNANYDEIISIISDIQTATNNNSCFYKNASTEKPITCKTILTGEHTDIDLIDRLNALGDLRKSDGHDRDKDENTLSLLIEHLGLGDFEQDKDQDLSTIQFYFTINLRMCMNRVLKHIMHSMILFHNIASFLYVKILCMKPSEIKKEQGDKDHLALDNAIVTLKKLLENGLMSRFPAFRDSLDTLTASDTVKESLQHEVSSRNGVTIDDIKESLLLIEKWQSVLGKRLSQLTTEQDEAMSKMMIVLLNYQSELQKFAYKIRKLHDLSSNIQKCLPNLNEQLEIVRAKEESAASEQKSAVKSTHKRRSSLFSSQNIISHTASFIDAAFGKDNKDVVTLSKSSV